MSLVLSCGLYIIYSSPCCLLLPSDAFNKLALVCVVATIANIRPALVKIEAHTSYFRPHVCFTRVSIDNNAWKLKWQKWGKAWEYLSCE